MAVLLAVGLKLDPKEVPSPFIGKPTPAFDLPRLYVEGETIGPKDMQGKVWLLNVWASWCVSCRAEHGVITRLIDQTKIEVIGLNYKDAGPDAKRWLAQFGNPYYAVAVDAEGRTGIDWGVYGVPETFLIDKKGIIRLKHIGPVFDTDLSEKLIPLIEQLRAEPA
ncbi:MAG: DsbE family thiol:disulfide interchange protein [Gammaproteobacteria bacterium]|nr:DsbE family thiol:disulfide interchange protein [Gammaproteobacteria bacterium]